MLALLVIILGLEGVDRALLERSMESMKPPREPFECRLLAQGKLKRDLERIPLPPPPPDRKKR